MPKYSWEISSIGEKLLSFLKNKLKVDISNKALKRIIEKGFCKVNGQIERFASRVLKIGDRVTIDPSWQNLLSEKEQKLEVLYEDDFLIIVNKPSGMVCEEQNLQNSLGHNYLLAHRLDKGTSGVLILAKNSKVQEALFDLFRQKKIKKHYLAIVDGKMLQKKGSIKYALAKSEKKGQLFCKTTVHGQEAETSWECLKTGPNYSLIMCELKTGRSHQLRVHLQKIKHPILGDYHYSRKFLYPFHVQRIMLHSYEVSFPHPFLQKKITVKSPVPKEFIDICGNVAHLY